MKPQDILFIVVFVLIALKGSYRLSAFVGIVSLFLAIPLFAFWIFFTAERLTWYAAAFFLLSIGLYLVRRDDK